MAKNVYKIPTSLGRSILDHEINLGEGGGLQLPPLPVKVIVFWVGSVFGLFWLLMNTGLKHSEWYLNLFIIIWWLVATAFLGAYGKTKELNVFKVPALFGYMPKVSRLVGTRTTDSPSGFYSIAGVDSIDDNGFITWGDGTVGQAYLVVGSASVLVFESDRREILDRVEAFYRKIDTTVELIWLTTKEPQRVWRQLAHLELTNRELVHRDPELQELMEERHSVLTEFVGGSFNSIHQYVVLKADNLEALRRAHTVLRSEAEESSLMIKQLSQMDAKDTVEMFRTTFAGQR